MGPALVREFPPSRAGSPVDPFPFVERLGVELLHADRGRTVMRLPLEPNVNHVGTMYAGALFTLAEVPGGHLFISTFDVSRFFPIVGEIGLRFHQPATTSVLVDARMGEAEIERVATELDQRGKARWVLVHELIDEHGSLVATSQATYFGLAL